MFNLFSNSDKNYIINKGINYNPVSGRFTDNKGKYRDTVIDSYGYRTIYINKKTYKSHRLIFLLSGIDLKNKKIKIPE